ncbi:P-loop containing nucleoside triphosphate hydrolase protein [Hyaloraphidium curvatum]|nr:P-loop containing nucleoside triphosphate hydrolase protein [Hyaloraphidium curvatum]
MDYTYRPKKPANGLPKSPLSNGSSKPAGEPAKAAPKPPSSTDTLNQKLSGMTLTVTPDPAEWDGDVRGALASGVLGGIQAVLRDKKAAAAAKESALSSLISMMPGGKSDSKALLPFLLPLLPTLLDLYAEKAKSTVELANRATNALLKLPSAWAYFPAVFPVLLDVAKSSGPKKESRVAALKHLGALVKRGAGRQVAEHLPEIIEGIEQCLHDISDDVSKNAIKALTELCAVITNADIVQHTEILVSCMARPNEVTSCIDKIARTTFVATVDGPSLAVMVPLLLRALQERSAAVMRQTAIIIENLSKLVVDPAEGRKFLPLLLPGVEKMAETAAFPEIRTLALGAKNSIKNVLEKGAAPGAVVDSRISNLVFPFAKLDLVAKKVASVVEDRLISAAKSSSEEGEGPGENGLNGVANGNGHAHGLGADLRQSIDSVVAPSLLELINFQEYDQAEWNASIIPYLKPLLPVAESAAAVAESIADDIYNHYDLEYQKVAGPRAVSPVDPNEVPLCDITFSLAYGTKLLLHNAHMRLVRGRRYGLIGRNGAGKSTLMRSIADGKVENFPGKEEGVRSIFVEHTIQGEDSERNIVDFVMASFKEDDAPPGKPDAFSRENVERSLRSVSFDDMFLGMHVGALSGGWKMKLALARAVLSEADLWLLDEPTNHLDQATVKWLMNYLLALKDVTILTVSHDTNFLDTVLTDVLHYEKNKKLKHYRGNLEDFVRQRPEAKTYYTLSASELKLAFPRAGILTGIRSQTKAILSMNDVTYTYPGRDTPSLQNVSCKISLSSKVAVLGPNGAGKSTLIKVLTGEVVPQQGSVSKHPNLRVGYIAQHAFHHLDHHLELTPNKYVQWRYATGEDREVTEKESRKMSEAEREQMEVKIEVRPGEFRRIECLVGRQKLAKSYQYEIKWRGMEHRDNTWVPRERLVDRGFGKLVQAFDDREASREGLVTRELNPTLIRKHFEDMGLEGDIADHTRIGMLSGGQKVKVVLAGALWNQPHVLVLDEPTNFLDRETLGALATAIRDWNGAVLMISHAAEFVSALATETWHVEGGRLTQTGRQSVRDDLFEDAASSGTGGGRDSDAGSSVAGDNSSHSVVDANLEEKVERLKAKRKKLTNKQLKERATRRRLRHLEWLASGKGLEDKPVDTDSESEK